MLENILKELFQTLGSLNSNNYLFAAIFIYGLNKLVDQTKWNLFQALYLMLPEMSETEWKHQA